MAVAVALPAVSPTVADLIGMEWDDYLFELNAWRDEEVQRGIKAMRLSPSLEVCRALLKGQIVPVDAMDQRWARKYGLL